MDRRIPAQDLFGSFDSADVLKESTDLVAQLFVMVQVVSEALGQEMKAFLFSLAWSGGEARQATAQHIGEGVEPEAAPHREGRGGGRITIGEEGKRGGGAEDADPGGAGEARGVDPGENLAEALFDCGMIDLSHWILTLHSPAGRI